MFHSCKNVEDIDKIERKTAAGIHAGQTVRHIKKGGTNEERTAAEEVL